uniref:Uncharacterized protein n=1 Tax=Rhizophora mucronata TaxID=61149 RepID=A0A2P2N4W5_RHIMU
MPIKTLNPLGLWDWGNSFKKEIKTYNLHRKSSSKTPCKQHERIILSLRINANPVSISNPNQHDLLNNNQQNLPNLDFLNQISLP